jgi:hypothetical protein
MPDTADQLPVPGGSHLRSEDRAGCIEERLVRVVEFEAALGHLDHRLHQPGVDRLRVGGCDPKGLPDDPFAPQATGPRCDEPLA